MRFTYHYDYICLKTNVVHPSASIRKKNQMVFYLVQDSTGMSESPFLKIKCWYF